MCISSGRLIAVPYNSATILEIGERVCMPSDAKDDTTSTVLEPPPTMSESISSMLMPVPTRRTDARGADADARADAAHCDAMGLRSNAARARP